MIIKVVNGFGLEVRGWARLNGNAPVGNNLREEEERRRISKKEISL